MNTSHPRLAIMQLADQGPAESTAALLRHAGYQVALPNSVLRDTLRGLGCDTVLDPQGLQDGMGYDPLEIPEVGPEAMDTAALYVDVKGHRNCPKVWKIWPRLKSRSLWVRINGGKPEHVIRRDAKGNVTDDCGDEVNPGMPVLTANMHYRGDANAYPHWPPFVHWYDYLPKHGRTIEPFHHDNAGDCFKDPHGNTPHAILKSGPPICLIHGVAGWGYSDLIPHVRYMGVKCYGSHGSPDGLVQHAEVPHLLSRAACYVSLRSNDCPGYSMYEAAAAACPMIVPRRLIHRMAMEDFLIPDETCMVFDGIEPGVIDTEACAAEIKDALGRLRDPELNWRIGTAARNKLAKLMWQADRDGPGFLEWMKKHFG